MRRLLKIVISARKIPLMLRTKKTPNTATYIHKQYLGAHNPNLLEPAMSPEEILITSNVSYIR
jgi:hypothetical protein